MIGRLMERHYFESRDQRGADAAEFLLRELRTPELLVEAATAFPGIAATIAGDRPAVALAMAGDPAGTARALDEEERFERELDREYWRPLKKELEELRHSLVRKDGAVDQD